MDVIIIGGGASGMVAGIIAARKGDKVAILEKNKVLGKKLLLTGNGRCNYYNKDMSLNHFHSNGDVNRFINDTNLNKLNDFFNSIGIIPKIKDNYYYPSSNTATSFQNNLVKELQVLNVKIINEEVIDIKKDNKFNVQTNLNNYKCDKVILATGGITYPKTGSNGFGYELLSKLGHHIIKPEEALVPLKTSDNVKDWTGIRTNVNVSYYLDDNYIAEEAGEAQLTDYGISGICIMNLSRYYDQNKDNKIIIDFLPTINNLYDFINDRNKLLKERTVIELLEMLINYKLLYFIFKKIHLDVNIRWYDMNDNEKKRLINNLKQYELKIIGTKGLEFGETTKGGLDLNEVTDNVESKIIPNLFITGELLDIDGICGGYNLTNAFITGILAGEA